MERRVYGLTFDDLDERFFERDQESGKVVSRLAGAMEIRDEGIAPRLDGVTLTETQASPVSITSAIKPSTIVAIEKSVTAQGNAANGSNARLAAALAALEARVAALENP